MSLDKQIINNYNNRRNKDSLYNSVYATFSDIEKQKKIKVLLYSFLQVSKNTSILEIGAGQGGNIPMLLNMGFKQNNIFVNELLPERIIALKTNYPNIKLFEGNALIINFNQTFDIIFQSTVFTSILNSSDRMTLATKMWEMLKPDGIILWYDFIYNNPKNIEVKKVNTKELKKLFPNAIKYKIVKTTLAPPIGRRVGKFYHLFNLPFLRSHIIAIFQK